MRCDIIKYLLNLTGAHVNYDLQLQTGESDVNLVEADQVYIGIPFCKREMEKMKLHHNPGLMRML